MEKEKFDFEAYVEWCGKKHLEPSEGASLDLFKGEMNKVAQTAEKAEKIAKQKEVFDMISKYLGKSVKYDEKYFEVVERSLGGIVFAMAMCVMRDETRKACGKILDDFGLNGMEKGND